MLIDGRWSGDRGGSVEVIPFVGFGGVRLGMTRIEVVAELGSPNSISTDKYGDEEWTYTEPAVACCFSPDDVGRLGSITFRSSAYTVGGTYIVGLSADELRRLGDTNVLVGLVLEDEMSELGAESYGCDVLGLGFWVSNGVVVNMTLYPRYDSSGDQPLWPASAT